MKVDHTRIAIGALICALAAPTTAMAQSEPDAADPQVQPGGIAEIIVTAQRVQESVQKAAIAIDVVSADELQKAQVTSPAQLTNLVPSLQVSRQGGGNVSFFLRGIGTFTANSYSDPAVAFNYDGVYISRPSATTGFFYDVARLEVLKGPQGTLYGRNATGGAINVIPVAPRIGENEGYFNVSFGNYDAVNLQGAANLAVGDNAAVRLSGTYVNRDGYATDGTSDEDSKGIRAQFAFEPTENFRVRLAGDYFRRQGRGASSTIIASAPLNPVTNTYAIIPTNFSKNSGSNGPEVSQLLSMTFNAQSGRFFEPLARQPELDGEFWGTSAEFNLDTEIGTFTLIAANRQHDTDDVTNGAGFLVIDQQDLNQNSVELRLAGNSGPIDYIIGGYYYDEKLDALYAPMGQSLNAYQNFETTVKSYAGFGRLTYNVTDEFRLVGGLRYTWDKKTIDGTNDVFLAICGALSHTCFGAPLLPFAYSAEEVIDQLGLVPAAAGQFPTPPFPPGALVVPGFDMGYFRAPSSVSSRLKDGKLTWRAAAEYDVGPQNLLYASVETGFRSGGFSFALSKPSFDAETLTAYTLGSKNRFFDNRMQLNVEAFYWKYKDQQLAHSGAENNGQPAFFTENVGGSTVKGAEAELQFLATENTLFAANVQYLDAVNDSFVYNVPATANPILSTDENPVYIPLLTGCATSGPSVIEGGAPVPQWTVDCSGLRASRAPKWTMTLGVQQTIPLGESRVVVGANTRYQSSNFTGFDQLSTDIQKGYWLHNADISYITAEDQLTIGAFINNISNYRAKLNSGYFASTGLVGASFSDPRTYGVRVSMKY
ncbi:TonB-dependent receptor [Croceicoccus bisphenolivorans]|uniref:TonB-dependent receptor n=1 Tax=Croceicoccus bisphenolivorans TaxID=1783232 RepID=UPI00082F2997|nr:TonB-dependent receptor [Croceicoccus bisphenolivorans]